MNQPSGLGADSWSFPIMDVWIEVKDSSYMQGGWHAVEMSEPAQAALLQGDDVVGYLVRNVHGCFGC